MSQIDINDTSLTQTALLEEFQKKLSWQGHGTLYIPRVTDVLILNTRQNPY